MTNEVLAVLANFDEAIASIDKAESFAFDIETTGLDPLTTDLLVLSLATEDGAWAIPFAGPVPHLRWQDPEMTKRIQHVFSDPEKFAISWNGGFDDKHLIHRGFNLRCKDLDGMVGIWLLDEMLARSKDIGLKRQAEIKLGVKMGEFADTGLLEGIVDEDACKYAADDAKYTYILWHDHVWPMLQEEGLTKVFTKICMPVLRVLVEMELNGCTLDVEQLRKVEKDLIEKTSIVLQELQDMSGNPKFNPGSSKQLSKLLFGSASLLKIPIKRGHEWKIKSSQWATDKRTLKRYQKDHPLFEKLTEFRKAKKLLSTYATPLQARALASKDGRVRSSYRLTGTVTGRLSSSAPNFQNISSDGGIREAFVPADGMLMVVADYSQIELRMGGCLAYKVFGKSNIVGKYGEGLDLHEATRQQYDAMGIDRFNEAAVGAEMARRNAKIANFGYFYGRSADAFAQDNPEVSFEEASMLRELFLSKLYPEIPAMHDHCVKELVENGFVKTITGRRRRFKYCYARDPRDVWWEGWVAWNAVTQGCQHPDGLILTDRGYVPLRDISPKSHVLVTEHGLIHDYVVHSVGKKRAISIETDAGDGIFSEDHRFGIYESGVESYVPLKSLTAGDWMIGATPRVIDGYEENRRCGLDEAYLLGAVIGDGSYSAKKNQISICASGHCQEYIDILAALISAAWNCQPKWSQSKGSRGHTKRTCINRNSLRVRLLELGLAKVSGEHKAIPNWIYSAPVDVRVSFLQGLMDTDGGFSSKWIVFTSISENVARGVWRILESLGIPARYRGRRRAKRVYIDTAYKSVYRRMVGFRHPIKIARLEKTPDSRGRLPASLISEVGNFILSQQETRQLVAVRVDTSSAAWSRRSTVYRRQLYNNKEFHLLHRLRKGSGTRTSCLEMLAKLSQSDERDRLQMLCNRRWVRLTSMCRRGKIAMLDIESYEHNKSYIGSGVTQHNSAQDVIQIAMRDVYADILVGREGGEVQSEDEILKLGADIWKNVKPLIQVHDEFVLEAPKEVANEIGIWLSYRMGRAVTGQPVVFPAEAGIGPTWITAKQAPKKKKKAV